MNKDEILTKVQSVCLELLIEVDKICNENNIRYFIYGGTLLGAVRHKGFIPWDDDIDLAMFRKDYEKFIKVCSKKLNHNKYYLQTVEKDITSTAKWCKLHKKNTAYINPVVRKDCYKGIAIDIFILDNVPNSKIIQNIIAPIHDFSNLIYFERFKKRDLKYQSIKGKLFRGMVNLTRIIPKKYMKILYEKRDKMFNKAKSDYIIHNSFRPFKKKLLPINYFDEDCKLNFEGHSFNAPKRWNELLVKYYGEDYMKLPPLDQRLYHPADIIDIDKSWEEYM